MFQQAKKEFEEKETEILNKIKTQTEAQMQNLRQEVTLTHFKLYRVF